MEDYLAHIGMPRRSGRYPWGSGEEPYQHSRDFVSRYNELEAQGYSEEQILKEMKLSSTQFRAMNTIAQNERRAYQIKRVESLKADGYNNSEIARMMGLSGESSVRTLMDEQAKENTMKVMQTADLIKFAIDSQGGKYIDIGPGVEKDLGITKEKLKAVEEYLKVEGYVVYPFRIPNQSGNYTTMRVVCPPGTQYKDAMKIKDDATLMGSVINYEEIPNINDKNTKIRQPFVYPASVDSDRVKVRFDTEKGPDGHTGKEKDGLIEIRPGVDDLNLGMKAYAQVRILVDGTHYIKGMAVYSDNLPEGIDIVVNSSKPASKGKLGALKEIETSDPNNPFGSLIKEGGQSYYIDKNGEEKLSAINKRAEEGDWGEWSKSLSSQFLVKQSNDLIQKQLSISLIDKNSEYEDICSITNPTLKKKMLMDFAEECDASAVYLKAAALPRQRYQVILPIASLKDNECYAPNYNTGDVVALVRFPHEGTYQIPILKVNNENKEGKEVLGKHPLDVVGINKKVADRLSGADFDGDTVLVIPTNSKIKITSTPELEGLKGFETDLYKFDKHATDSEGNDHYYRNGREFKVLPKNRIQKEMGVASNLITDMTVKGATREELEKATKYSMTVIDANKHKLDYKQCALDNDIDSLKKKYQMHDDGTYGGASTLLSSAKSVLYKDKTIGQPKINQKDKEWYDPDKPEGSLIYKTATGDDLYYTKRYKDSKGNIKEKVMKREIKSSKMAETDDAYTLSTGTYKENLYAEYANSLKSMANKARLESTKVNNIKYNSEANKKYQSEVQDLEKQLLIAERNKPRERMAQAFANSEAKAMKLDNPTMDKETYRKIKQQALTRARAKVGAKKEKIIVSDKQWEAMQSGAIHETTLRKIFDNMDSEDLKKRAIPKQTNSLSTTKVAQIRAYANSGYNQAEIAKELGISVNTVNKYLN